MPKKVMVVDDNEELGVMLEVVLGNEGFKVQRLTTAQQGREACKDQTPDIAIIDYLMPGELGIDLARELSKRDVPTIVYTAFPNHAIQQEVEAFGASFISKVLIDELLSQVKQYSAGP